MDNNYNNNNGAGGEGGPKKQNILLYVLKTPHMIYVMMIITIGLV